MVKKIIIFLAIATNIASFEQKNITNTNEIFLDEYGTRYQLAQSNPGCYNWLFVPGGAGADSCYYWSLINILQLPGKIWLVDFPENGSNAKADHSYEFDQWAHCLLSCVKKFQHPIYVGHSFGAMFPLLFPDLESMLDGFIMIGSAPQIDADVIKKMIHERNITISSESAEEFKKMPTDSTFRKALLTRLPCHFPSISLNEGRRLFETLPFNFHAMLWWGKKVSNFSAAWVPQRVPTLIIGGSEDCINPVVLFKHDRRFQRNNIVIEVVQGAGHFPWFEKKEAIKDLFTKFIRENLK